VGGQPAPTNVGITPNSSCFLYSDDDPNSHFGLIATSARKRRPLNLPKTWKLAEEKYPEVVLLGQAATTRSCFGALPKMPRA
jgi:hypothetical protein